MRALIPLLLLLLILPVGIIHSFKAPEEDTPSINIAPARSPTGVEAKPGDPIPPGIPIPPGFPSDLKIPDEALERRIEEAWHKLRPYYKELGVRSCGPFFNYLLVGIRDDATDEELKQAETRIREIIGEDVPLIIARCRIELDVLTVPVLESSESDKYRPVRGGIQCQVGLKLGTIGFTAIRTNGEKGFVISGHLGNVGDAVYQLTASPDNYCNDITINPPKPRLPSR